MRSVIAAICATRVDDDGVAFDADSVTTDAISEEADYHGVRALFVGHLGKAALPMQIDIGFSDVISPGPVEIAYPTLLDMPSITLAGYNRETTIAEKVEAMLKLGEMNSRMKDFYDVWALSGNGSFRGQMLWSALRATCAQRGTDIASHPFFLSDEFAVSAVKQTQWTAFRRRFRDTQAPLQFADIIGRLRVFLAPLLTTGACDRQWSPDDAWC